MGTSRLKVLMAEKDISTKELANLTGISYRNLNAIINGHQKPRLENAHVIAEALSLHINKVFPDLYRYESIAKKRA